MDKDLQHSINYITSKTGGKSGFSIPKGYFDNLENTILTQKPEKKLPKQKAFDVPVDYFTEFENRMLTKVSETGNHQQKEGNVISLKQRIYGMIPYAAVASVLLFVSIYFVNNYESATSIDNITASDIEDWYSNSYEVIDENELAMVLTGDDLNDNDFLNTSNDNDLEVHLQNIDITLLNEIQ